MTKLAGLLGCNLVDIGKRYQHSYRTVIYVKELANAAAMQATKARILLEERLVYKGCWCYRKERQSFDRLKSFVRQSSQLDGKAIRLRLRLAVVRKASYAQLANKAIGLF